ncbi:MAG: hypothetical protein JW955_01530 [Sedimentisphaerales bacterium]|nr:hypothetical protein [Sedimentisphaerales bacterium]
MRKNDQTRQAGPTGDAAKREDARAVPTATTTGLASSFFESWGLYFQNIGSVWAFSFVIGFRAIGAFFSGKMLQIALAATDFFVKLKAKDPSPNQNIDRLCSLSNEHLGIDAKKNRKEMFKVMSPAILVVMLCPIAAVVGAITLGWLGFFGVLLLAALVYFRALTILMLNVGLFIKFGPGDIEAHRTEINSILKQYTIPFASYMCLSAVASYAGLILCCIGIFLTAPYMGVAGYVGMINILGIQISDIDKFFEATQAGS